MNTTMAKIGDKKTDHIQTGERTDSLISEPNLMKICDQFNIIFPKQNIPLIALRFYILMTIFRHKSLDKYI